MSETMQKECDGYGFCLKQCWCECFDEIDEDTYVDHEICTCGHREHNGFCPSTCRCSLQECRYFSFCKQKLPEMILDCHFGMCANCAIQTGPHTLTDQVKECFICFEEKTMLQLKCTHQMCKECWFQITKVNFEEGEHEHDPKCPMCRKSINWSRKDGDN